MSAASRLTTFDRNVVCIMGLPFDVIDTDEAARRVQHATEQRHPCLISTANLNFVIAARNDDRFRDSVIHSEMCVADGMPIVWVARLLGLPVRERVAGATLFEHLKESLRRPRVRIYFFGGPDGVGKRACDRINERHGGVECVGFESPGFGDLDSMSDAQTLRRINDSDPDFVIVSLGAKKGQAWIERNRALLNAPVISHLGAVVNFAAGTIERAPSFVQRLGFEWLWRIKEEPMLWRRYARDGVAFANVLMTGVLPLWWQRVVAAAAGHGAAPKVEICTSDIGTTVTLAGHCTGHHREVLRNAFRHAAQTQGAITIDLSKVTRLDAWAMGLLLLLYGHQRDAFASLVLAGVSAPLRRQFLYHGTSFLLDRSGSISLSPSESRFA